MSDEKICIVCNKNCKCVVCRDIHNNINIDSNTKEEIIKLMLDGCKTTSLIESFNKVGITLPSQYLLKLHQTECLKINPDEIRKSKKYEDSKKVENEVKEEKPIFQDIVDMEKILEDYRNMSFQERENNYLRMLREVDYMSLVSIHHQLLYGKMSKSIVPKEDIGALKNVQDILQVLTENSFDDEEIPEININVINPHLVNEEILQQYEFPLSKDIAEEYKRLKEKSNENNYDIEDINNENNYDDNNDIEKYIVNEENNIEENNIEESNNEDNKENDNGDWNW